VGDVPGSDELDAQEREFAIGAFRVDQKQNPLVPLPLFSFERHETTRYPGQT